MAAVGLGPVFLLLMATPQLAGIAVVYAAERVGRRELRALAPAATAFTFVVTSFSVWGANLLEGRVTPSALGTLAGATALGVAMHWVLSSAALAGALTSRRAGQSQRERADGLR